MSETPASTSQSEDTIYAVAGFNQTIFAARQTGLYRTVDNGIHWENVYQAWQPDTSYPTLAVTLSPNFEKDNVVIAGVNGGVMLSTDRGQTWVAHQFRNPLPMVTCVAISPYFATDQTILAGTYEDGMFRSTDAGQSWQAFNFGLFDHNILCVTASPNFQNDSTIYVGTSSGIYKSINGGRLWHDGTLPIGADAVLSLALSPDFASDKIIYAGTENSGLLQSCDGGATWTSIYEMDSAINAILLASDMNKTIAQADDTVMTSDDGGGTWTSAIEENVNAVMLSSDSQFIVAGLADTSIQTVNLLDS